MLSGVKSVIQDSMPALLTAEQRLAEGDEDELESLEEAKAALVDEAIEVIQARLKSHIEEMVVESTDKIFTTTIAPALNGMLSALVEPVPSDQIMTGEAAEEAEVQEPTCRDAAVRCREAARLPSCHVRHEVFACIACRVKSMRSTCTATCSKGMRSKLANTG